MTPTPGFFVLATFVLSVSSQISSFSLPHRFTLIPSNSKATFVNGNANNPQILRPISVSALASQPLAKELDRKDSTQNTEISGDASDSNVAPTVDSDGPRDQQLLQWITNEGGMTSLVEIKANKYGLRGLYNCADKDIKSGDVVVTVPYSSALLVGDAIEDDTNSNNSSEKEINEDVKHALYFLTDFVNNTTFSPYVESLPGEPDRGDDFGLPPHYWSDEVIKVLP